MGKLRQFQQAQRRTFIWLTAIAAAPVVIAGLLHVLRRRQPDGRHVMPETPGDHETGTVRVDTDGRLSTP